jgi:hypothetical protein
VLLAVLRAVELVVFPVSGFAVPAAPVVRVPELVRADLLVRAVVALLSAVLFVGGTHLPPIWIG